MALLLETLRIGYQQVVVEQHPTQLYDWLISYAGGFVRRGLAGSVLSATSEATGTSLPMMAYLLQAALYVTFAVAMLALLRGVRLTWALAIPVTAPFLFPFPVLAHNAGFRKDILALALLAATAAVIVHTRDEARRFALLLVAVVLFVPVVLVHEFLVVMLPYLAVLGVGVRWTSRRVRLMASALGLIAVAVVASLVAHGSPAHVAAICDSLQEQMTSPQPPSTCGTRGALRWIGADTGEGVALVGRWLDRQLPGLVWVVPLVVVGLAPAVLETAAVVSRPRLRVASTSIGLAVAATLPVFVVALDWGRLLYLHAVGVTVILLALRHGQPSPGRPARWPALLLAPYALMWTLGPNGQLLRGGWWESVMG